MAYADITYGFYKAQSALFGLEATVVPLREDFTLRVEDYLNFPGTVVIANPNAPTGIALPRTDIQRLVESNPDRVVIVDEAYVDFGAESCVPMILRYENLLVTQTMSKSRSLAGGRVGFALGSPELISALNRVKYSFNPYNVNRLSHRRAAAMEDEDYFRDSIAAIEKNRAWTTRELEALGFTVLPSSANFILAKSDRMSGETLYRTLKENGILVRWWADQPRIRDYIRVTIGSAEQMAALVDEIARLLDM